MEDIFELAEESEARHCMIWSDAASGLRALMVIDDVTLGPAAGGVRTQPYPSLQHALHDASGLARAMTLKCALAGLDAGGGKIVVLEHGGLRRPAAYEALGERLHDLMGRFRAGSDLGTRTADLEAMGRRTPFVHVENKRACAGVARSVLRCIEACAAERDRKVADLKVAVQGAGAVGAAVARALAEAGAALVVADVDQGRARELGREVGGRVCAPEEVLLSDVDVVSPCAVGGVLTPSRAADLKAWAVCGGANNILASPRTAEVLLRRDVLYVPDIVSSAGGVIEGIGRDVMGLSDRSALFDRLFGLAREILEAARVEKRTTVAIAEARARTRIEASRAAT